MALQISKRKVNPLGGYKFIRLGADRYVRPEPEGAYSTIEENGSGATTLIQENYNDRGKDRGLVTDIIRSELNKILEPDGSVQEIIVDRDTKHSPPLWEVVLREDPKGYIPISMSSSGLKTILLVLSHLYITAKNISLSKCIFGFEELENNLHPALQRRMFIYLRRFAEANECHFVITTHSSVVIDLFAEDPAAQIVHVTHDGEQATATPVLTYSSRTGVLDDLDVRASDLLQANGIIWVEGPTDMLYVNQWIKVWTEGRLNGPLREGRDYQCVFYGGALIAHPTAEEPSLVSHAVEVLRVNRNAAILIDSDRKEEGAGLKPSAERMTQEVTDVGGYAWTTEGREVEHYIPASVYATLFGGQSRGPTTFKTISDYLSPRRSVDGENFKGNKVGFAQRVVPLLSKEALLESGSDLPERLEQLIAHVDRWNSNRPPTPPEAPAG